MGDCLLGVYIMIKVDSFEGFRKTRACGRFLFPIIFFFEILQSDPETSCAVAYRSALFT
jgi:hypothetical protein